MLREIRRGGQLQDERTSRILRIMPEIPAERSHERARQIEAQSSCFRALLQGLKELVTGGDSRAIVGKADGNSIRFSDNGLEMRPAARAFQRLANWTGPLFVARVDAIVPRGSPGMIPRACAGCSLHTPGAGDHGGSRGARFTGGPAGAVRLLLLDDHILFREGAPLSCRSPRPLAECGTPAQTLAEQNVVVKQ